MGPAIFIIAIMGCGEGDSPCQQVRMLDARYESQAACIAASEAALTQNTDIEYPVVSAECVTAGATPNAPAADAVQRPGPGSADLKVSPIRS
jgi:ABC-type hemin transport system ATPase subunit